MKPIWIIWVTIATCGASHLLCAQQNNIPVVDSVLEARLSNLEKKTNLVHPGQSRLLVVGLTTFGYVSSRNVTTDADGNTVTTKNGVFGSGNTYEFSPMFLFKQGKRLLVEFEPSFNNDGLGVNWAAISYFASPNVILRGGYFVLPFGMYNKKLAAGWINKVATDPIGLPTAQDYGIGASGGVQLGSIKWNYDVSVSNGFALQNDGSISHVNLGANARGKTFSGRLGLLPLSNNSLEVGISSLSGDAANGNADFLGKKVNMYAFDLNYVKNFSPFQVNIKSQYNAINVDNQNYQDTTKAKNNYSFTNSSTSGYGQFSLRPIDAKSNFIKNLEVAFRYGTYNSPQGSYWGNTQTQIDYGINYWITWRTVIRVTYELLEATTTANKELNIPFSNSKTSALHIQFSVQL